MKISEGTAKVWSVTSDNFKPDMAASGTVARWHWQRMAAVARQAACQGHAVLAFCVTITTSNENPIG